MAIRPKWIRKDEILPDYCGSDQRSELGQMIWELLEDVGSLSDFIRHIAEGSFYDHKERERQAKLTLKALKSRRLMRDGKVNTALALFWNNDDVSDVESWQPCESSIPEHGRKYLE